MSLRHHLRRHLGHLPGHLTRHLRHLGDHVPGGVLVLGSAALLLSTVVLDDRSLPAAAPAAGAAPGGGGTTSYAVPAPEPSAVRARRPALMLLAAGGAAAPTTRQVAALRDVAHVERLGLASVRSLGRTMTVAAVDPAGFRAWSDRDTAAADGVWAAVARGEAAVTHAMSGGLGVGLGESLPLDGAAVPLRVAAIATTVPGFDVVLNRPRAAALGVPVDNALLVAAAPGTDLADLLSTVGRRWPRADVVDLTGASSEPTVQTARLVGGSVADAVGAFTYAWSADGTVRPDPAWVSASIVTGEVPLLGTVTCHRVMLPALRGAMQQVVDAGLAGLVDADDFGGCYVPRFIGRDPGRGLSLHTWGIAVDLNVQGNLPGTAGSLDPRVVEVMRSWGFAWGGDWRVPDPMHFELAALPAG